MTSLNVAVVSRDASVRLAAARAFDHAPSSWRIRLHDAPPGDADVVVFGADLGDRANGHILFDPAATGDVIEEVRRSVAAARCKVFVVTGAGRGVGVTSLALHLAAGSARHRSTCFFDLDLDWGAADRLGIAADHRSWQDVIADKEELKMVALPVAGGFRALLAPRRGAPGPAPADNDVSPRDGVDAPRAQPLRVARAPDVPDRDAPEVQEAEHASPSVAGRRADPAARDVLRATVKDFERVVIDCPDLGVAGSALGDVDAGVLVVPPTMPGVRRAAAVLERHDAVRWAVVLNRMGPGGETTRAELHRVLGRRTALELPCSPSLRDAEDDARLVTSSWTRYVRRVDRLLHALEGGP